MFSHITLGTNDLARAKAFYDAVIGPIGYPMIHDESAHDTYGYGPETPGAPSFWILRPLNRQAATFGNGTTIGFVVTRRALVDRFHAAALAAGGTCEGLPGLRPQYHADYYGAYVRDPDGNKLCCACHLPADQAG
ncbi:MAG: VOC family protein [Beijerinckiaceae bacterium]|jgi:catechol 2,3-dioxygenase-like lactoylglutathione lyase family enzyme|nr:VOC family protein [Beijerinckiaceae bacterium]